MKRQLQPPRPKHISSEEYAGLLCDASDVFSVQGDDVVTLVLAAYIDYVHPHMPFLDLSLQGDDTLKMVCSGLLSPCLLHALLGAGWQHAPGLSSRAAGLQSPLDASQSSLRKAQVGEYFARLTPNN